MPEKLENKAEEGKITVSLEDSRGTVLGFAEVNLNKGDVTLDLDPENEKTMYIFPPYQSGEKPRPIGTAFFPANKDSGENREILKSRILQSLRTQPW